MLLSATQFPSLILTVNSLNTHTHTQRESPDSTVSKTLKRRSPAKGDRKRVTAGRGGKSKIMSEAREGGRKIPKIYRWRKK